MGRIICELERIYGIQNGNNQYTKEDKNLLKLLPELQDMVQVVLLQHR
mgnify:FL=1